MSRRERILVIRLSSVGDVVLATSVLEGLSRLYPEAKLDFLVDAGQAPLLAGNPFLRRVYAFEHRGRHRGPGGIGLLASEIGPVDLVVDLQHKLRTVMLTHRLKPGEKRVYVKRSGMGLVRAMVGSDSVLRGPHQVERFAEVALGQAPEFGAGLRPRLVVDPDRRKQAAEDLGVVCGEAGPLGLVLGARHATKRWPAAHWAALCRLAREDGQPVVLLGGPDGAETAEQVVAELGDWAPAVLLQGDLGRLAARLSQCRLVVCPDSGPGHMAAALGLPTVSLFGSTAPERWAPLGPRVQVLSLDLSCAPCSNHGSATCPLDSFDCMRQLKPELVWEAVRRGLQD